MRLISMLASLLLIVSVQSVHAGCANFEDGSMQMEAPRFEICYNGVCDVTSLSYECANVYSSQIRFDIGWSKDCDLNRTDEYPCTVYWEGRPIEQSKYGNITCEPLNDEDICNFP